MGTKNNPGTYDCYAAAEPDEPLFTLLARDPTAPWLVAAWRQLRAGKYEEAAILMAGANEALKKSKKKLLTFDSPKLVEAVQCVKDMEDWRQKNR